MSPVGRNKRLNLNFNTNDHQSRGNLHTIQVGASHSRNDKHHLRTHLKADTSIIKDVMHNPGNMHLGRSPRKTVRLKKKTMLTPLKHRTNMQINFYQSGLQNFKP